MPDRELVHSIVTAIANCALYDRNHPVVLEYAKKTVRFLDELYVNDACSVLVLDSALVVNDRPFSGPADLGAGLARRFRQKRISKAVFRRGVTVPELLGWVANMASPEAAVPTPHIAMGAAAVHATEERLQPDEQYEQAIRVFADLYAAAGRTRTLDPSGVHRIVTEFLDLLDRERNILRIIGPFKSHSAYTLVHITNVTILSVFLARALGMDGGMLRDVGIAALMHDVGKLFIPAAVIEKPGALDPLEWERMKHHTVHGALFLSRQRQMPPIAAVVAFEHHLRYDGAGYPATRWGRRQHLVSQIVAIADTFEAMRMARPYKRSLDVVQIAGVLTNGAGTLYNPQLVPVFLAAFGESASMS